MDQVPRRNSRKRRGWLLALPLTCTLLLGAWTLLLSPSDFHHTAFAAGTTVTPVSDPFVQITSPTPHTVLFPNQAPLLITAVAGWGGAFTVSQVSFSVDGTQIGIATEAPYSVSWTMITPGSHTLLATAIFSNGFRLNSPSVPVTVQTGGSSVPTATPCPCGTPPSSPSAVPTLSITSPANGATFVLPTTITITATASAFVLAKVDFYASLAMSASPVSPLIGTATTPPYQINWSPGSDVNGSVNLHAVATDSLGRMVTSPVVTVQVIGETANCAVHYQENSQWAGGFSANVTISNLGSTALNGWSLQFTFPGDQQITQIWNGSGTQRGEVVTITNLSYNGTISPGSSIPLGFNGTWTNNDSLPPSFILNGVICATS